MQQLRSFLFFCFLLCFILGCRQKNSQFEEFVPLFDNFTSVKRISDSITNLELILATTNISGSFTSFVVADSVLYCGNLRSSKLINAYDLKTGSLIAELIDRGTDSTQGLSVENLFLGNGTLWVHDITASKLFKLDISKRQNINIGAQTIILLDGPAKNMISPTIIDDNTFVSTTFTHKDCRYIYATADNVFRKAGVMPKIKNLKRIKDTPNAKIPNIAFAFKAKLAKHPSDEKIAVFYAKTGIVEFYSEDSIRETVTGPNDFGPKMHIEKLDDGYSINDDNKTIYAYTSISSSKEGIYSLYAGHTKDENYSKRIFFFDWNGNLKEIFQLDRPVVSIFFDSENKTMYCYSEADNIIYSAKL